jgi:serine/threonine protein kinase
MRTTHIHTHIHIHIHTHINHSRLFKRFVSDICIRDSVDHTHSLIQSLTVSLSLFKDGVVKLADFGASAKLKDDTEKRYSIVGTPYWSLLFFFCLSKLYTQLTLLFWTLK